MNITNYKNTQKKPSSFYNPAKFSMDNAWTSNPTWANMTLEIPTSNKHRTSDAFLIVMIYFIKRRTLFNSDDLFMYIIILAINCHSLFCLWVVSPLQCRSSILVFILFYMSYILLIIKIIVSVKCKCL